MLLDRMVSGVRSSQLIEDCTLQLKLLMKSSSEGALAFEFREFVHAGFFGQCFNQRSKFAFVRWLEATPYPAFAESEEPRSKVRGIQRQDPTNP